MVISFFLVEFRKWLLLVSLLQAVCFPFVCFSLCRPFFTYWISFVQTVVLIVGLAVYGFAPIGFTERKIEGVVSDFVPLSLFHVGAIFKRLYI